MRFLVTVTAIALLPVLTGCSILTTHSLSELDDGTQSPEGVVYSLPLGLLAFKLKVEQNTARYFLAVEEPRFVPDPQAQYIMKYRPRSNYDDEISITTNNNSFITEVKAKAKDRTGDIIVELARAASGLSALQVGTAPATTTVLDQAEIDPTDEYQLKSVEQRLNIHAYAYAERMSSYCASHEEYLKSYPDACREYDRISSYDKARGQLIKVDVTTPTAVAPTIAVDCSKGLCYRPVRLVHIMASVGGGSTHSAFVELPNGSPLIGIDIQRAFLVEKTTNINFDGTTGLFKSLSVVKPSEALAAAKLPIAIAQAVLEAPTSLIQLKVDHVTAEEELVKKQLDLSKAEGQLDALQAGAGQNAGQESVSVRGNILEATNVVIEGITPERTSQNDTPAEGDTPPKAPDPATPPGGPGGGRKHKGKDGA